MADGGDQKKPSRIRFGRANFPFAIFAALNACNDKSSTPTSHVPGADVSVMNVNTGEFLRGEGVVRTARRAHSLSLLSLPPPSHPPSRFPSTSLWRFHLPPLLPCPTFLPRNPVRWIPTWIWLRRTMALPSPPFLTI